MTAPALRYSREQILCGLRAILRDEGIGNVADNEQFDLAQIEMFGEEVHWKFGIELSEADGKALAELTENRRVRFRGDCHFCNLNVLADFLQERVPAVSFDAACIAGTRCKKAGAFLGLRDIAGSIEGVERFAPSTQIQVHLKRRQLRRLWKRLQWISRDTLPPLKERWTERAAMLFLFSCLAVLGSGVAAALWGALTFVMHALSACKLSWMLWSAAERFENPLPDDIVTFGDLARRIAVAESDSASW